MALSARSIADLPVMHCTTAMWPACIPAGLSTNHVLNIQVHYLKQELVCRFHSCVCVLLGIPGMHYTTMIIAMHLRMNLCCEQMMRASPGYGPSYYTLSLHY